MSTAVSDHAPATSADSGQRTVSQLTQELPAPIRYMEVLRGTALVIAPTEKLRRPAMPLPEVQLTWRTTLRLANSVASDTFQAITGRSPSASRSTEP